MTINSDKSTTKTIYVSGIGLKFTVIPMPYGAAIEPECVFRTDFLGIDDLTFDSLRALFQQHRGSDGLTRAVLAMARGLASSVGKEPIYFSYDYHTA